MPTQAHSGYGRSAKASLPAQTPLLPWKPRRPTKAIHILQTVRPPDEKAQCQICPGPISIQITSLLLASSIWGARFAGGPVLGVGE